MGIELLTIPGLNGSEQTACKVRALGVDGKSLAIAALVDWSKSETGDYGKIMKVLRMLGQLGRIRDERKVKKNQNPAHGEVYEAGADKGKARLMFFYDEADDLVVVCTNHHWKGKGNQDTAFKHCAAFKEIYLSSKSRKK